MFEDRNHLDNGIEIVGASLADAREHPMVTFDLLSTCALEAGIAAFNGCPMVAGRSGCLNRECELEPHALFIVYAEGSQLIGPSLFVIKEALEAFTG